MVVGSIRADRDELMFCVYAFICSSCNHRAVGFARGFVQRRGDDVVDARLIRLRLPSIVGVPRYCSSITSFFRPLFVISIVRYQLITICSTISVPRHLTAEKKSLRIRTAYKLEVNPPFLRPTRLSERPIITILCGCACFLVSY